MIHQIAHLRVSDQKKKNEGMCMERPNVVENK
jgi:hypothetical protein